MGENLKLKDCDPAEIASLEHLLDLGEIAVAAVCEKWEEFWILQILRFLEERKCMWSAHLKLWLEAPIWLEISVQLEIPMRMTL